MTGTLTCAAMLAAAKQSAGHASSTVSNANTSALAHQVLLAILCALADLGYSDPLPVQVVRDTLPLESLLSLSRDMGISRESKMLIEQYLAQANILSVTPRAVRSHIPVQVFLTQVLLVAESCKISQ